MSDSYLFLTNPFFDIPCPIYQLPPPYFAPTFRLVCKTRIENSLFLQKLFDDARYNVKSTLSSHHLLSLSLFVLILHILITMSPHHQGNGMTARQKP